MHFQAVVVKSPRAGREGGGVGGINFVIEMKKDRAHNGAWQVGRRNSQRGRGNRRGSGARREEGITAECSGAAGREGTVGVCKGTRASAACVATNLPSSLFLIPSFLCSATRPSRISLPMSFSAFSRFVAGHNHSACALHETFINACLTFWGLRPKKSWRFT